ncbi:uncharacterized protein K460DRAFT_366363 [Cucurbitaria berberidis CBS 394.84]|uniref:Uncharacterized protein n=1 Tax=Cucurbitaria berberidis CBS 394.84 TaxID=1168544 RepID=A0A9P4GG75_9PLEO|nr:uncharacterized protein K460DRAFT_366363 [Cucurbitaria berberidis CBS 394.84]KAF1845488.1 hypothetical protein K460DRAFT_366363 [Cucurbitaria berberidis CBS 394.84]
MTTNRKRPAQLIWKDPIVSKVSRTIDTEVTPPVPRHRLAANCESHVGPPLLSTPARALASSSRPSIQSLPPSASKVAIENTPSRASQSSLVSQKLVQRVVPELSHTRSIHSPISIAEPATHKPSILHQPHPDSKLCQDFHWVPYPLGLMPYNSWHHLHHREDVQPSLPFVCPVCRRERKATAHMRKVFLVAERLTWEEGLVSTHEKDINEELNWKFNYELGVLLPFVEDAEHVKGGKNSRANIFYPYQNEHEAKLALRFIFMTENVTETSWALWIGMQLDLEKMLGEHEGSNVVPSSYESLPEEQKSPQLKDNVTLLKNAEVELIDDTVSADRASEPSASSHHSNKRIMSYQTLQDFYSLLDRIERTSYVAAWFLEAYAEKLRDDMCQDCWFDHNVKVDVF